MNKTTHRHRINEAIRTQTVRLIHGENNAVLPLREAIAQAKALGMDLIEVSAQSDPPVCKICEYGRFLYQQEKAKKGQAQDRSKTKEIGLHANVAEHDLQTKLNQAKGFLEKRCQVLFRLKFRGRENAHKDMGAALLERIRETLSQIGVSEPARANGNMMLLRVSPK